jgi:hypothetical protein
MSPLPPRGRHCHFWQCQRVERSDRLEAVLTLLLKHLREAFDVQWYPRR